LVALLPAAGIQTNTPTAFSTGRGTTPVGAMNWKNDGLSDRAAFGTVSGVYSGGTVMKALGAVFVLKE